MEEICYRYCFLSPTFLSMSGIHHYGVSIEANMTHISSLPPSLPFFYTSSTSQCRTSTFDSQLTVLLPALCLHMWHTCTTLHACTHEGTQTAKSTTRLKYASQKILVSLTHTHTHTLKQTQRVSA